jgi:hypothetical protein
VLDRTVELIRVNTLLLIEVGDIHVVKLCTRESSVNANNEHAKAIPGQALRVPGGRGSQIFRQSLHEGGKVVSPMHRPPLPPQEIFLVLISVRG